jgi:hypothetical protein
MVCYSRVLLNYSTLGHVSTSGIVLLKLRLTDLVCSSFRQLVNTPLPALVFSRMTDIDGNDASDLV